MFSVTESHECYIGWSTHRCVYAALAAATAFLINGPPDRSLEAAVRRLTHYELSPGGLSASPVCAGGPPLWSAFHVREDK